MPVFQSQQRNQIFIGKHFDTTQLFGAEKILGLSRNALLVLEDQKKATSEHDHGKAQSLSLHKFIQHQLFSKQGLVVRKPVNAAKLNPGIIVNPGFCSSCLTAFTVLISNYNLKAVIVKIYISKRQIIKVETKRQKIFSLGKCSLISFFTWIRN